jgi:hypothetical protein
LLYSWRSTFNISNIGISRAKVIQSNAAAAVLPRRFVHGSDRNVRIFLFFMEFPCSGLTFGDLLRTSP